MSAPSTTDNSTSASTDSVSKARIRVVHYSSDADLPQSVLDSVPDSVGRNLFRHALNDSVGLGHTEIHGFVRAWRTLRDAGYTPREDGVWEVPPVDVNKDATLSDVHTNKPIGVLRYNQDDCDEEDKDDPNSLCSDFKNKKEIDKGGVGSGVRGHTTPRPKGRGPHSEREVSKIQTNSGKSVSLYKLTPGGNLNTDTISNSVFKEDQGFVRVNYNVSNGSLYIPDAGLSGVDHGDYMFDVETTGAPDLNQVRGVLDLNTGHCDLYDLKEEASTIAEDNNMLEARAANIVANNLKAASKSSFYVNGKRVRFSTTPFSSVVGFGKSENVTKRISGSSDIGLNAKGRTLADRLGERIAAKGGLDVLWSSPLRRATQTAAAILENNETTTYGKPQPALQPWHLGEYEGADPQDVEDEIAFYIENHQQTPQGTGADGKDAESFDESKERQLNFFRSVWSEWEDNPTAKFGIITHSRGQLLLQAWVAAGCPDDLSIADNNLEDPDALVTHAEMLYWHDGRIEEINLADDTPLLPGVYLILHSLTDDDVDEGNDQLQKHNIEKIIRHEKDGWHVYSHDGKKHLGGPYSKEGAVERLRQVEGHKNKADDNTVYLPPVEVQRAAKHACDMGLTVLDITPRLADGTGLKADAITSVLKYFETSESKATPSLYRDAWGGNHAHDWARRVMKKIARDKADADHGSSALVYFAIDPVDANRMAVENGEKPEEMHVTLAYLGKPGDINDNFDGLDKVIEEFASNHSHVVAETGGPVRFEASEYSDGKDVCVATINSATIQTFRKQLVDALEQHGFQYKSNFTYTPHVTLAYIEPGAPLPIDKVEPHPMIFNRISLNIGSQRKDFPLNSQPASSVPELLAVAKETGSKEGHWITVNGQHILVDAKGNQIGGNPKALGQKKVSAKVELARKHAVLTGAHEQRIADEVVNKLSRMLGIPSTPNNEAFDLENSKLGIEVKTMTHGHNDKITMGKTALKRKLDQMDAKRVKGYTIVADMRGRQQAKYYMREGFGSFRVSSMRPVTIKEIRSMLNR